MKRVKRAIKWVFLALLVASVIWMAVRGREGTVYFSMDTDEPALDCQMVPEDGPELIEVTGFEAVPGGGRLHVRASQPGSGWYYLQYQMENGGGVEMIHIRVALGLLWIDFVPQGSELLTVACLLGMALLLVYLCIAFHESELQTPYSYHLLALGGGILFVAFCLAGNLVLLIDSLRDGYLPGIGSIVMQTTSLPAALNRVLLPLLIAAFAAMAVSNLWLLMKEGKKLKNLLGAVLGGLLIAATIVGMVLQAKETDTATRFVARHSLQFFFCGLLSYVECMMISVCACAVKAARHVPPMDRDYVLILGCAFAKDGRLYPLLRGRVDRALAFVRRQKTETGKTAVLVPSGGQGRNESMAEAEAMKRYLLQQGVAEAEILPEDRSRNTYENMTCSKALIDGIFPDAKIAFSTTNYHVLRAGIYASEAGLRAEGMGSPTAWYFWPNAFVRELAALFVNRRKKHLLAALVLLAASVTVAALLYVSML